MPAKDDFTKKTITLPDGRYLIYYDFDMGPAISENQPDSASIKNRKEE